MDRRLFLDFDGTLVDSKRRQYELFLELGKGASLTFDEYWECKQAGVNQRDMLLRFTDHAETEYPAFKAAWVDSIEEPVRLDTDKVIPGVIDFLTHAAKEFRLCVVTGRQHHDLLIRQMKQLSIFEFFSDVLNTAQRQTKTALVRAHYKVDSSDVFIGDTGEDVVAGKELGTYTVGVTSGGANRERLKKYGPNLLVNSVCDLNLSTLGME